MRKIENPYPSFTVPDLNLFVNQFPDILIAAAAIMFVSFSGEIPVVQAFSKDKRGFDPNKEFYALGAADVLIGFFKGYPVSGADSRTAANVAVGGKTKLVNLVAAFLMIMVVVLIPGVFATIPLVTFGAIIVFAGIGMFSRGAGLGLFRSDKREFLVFAVCALGVLTLGVYQGILFALVLSFLQLIKRSSKPEEYELVYDKETMSGAEYVADSGLVPDPKVLIYRFNSALLFYNVNYFAGALLSRADAKPDLELIVIDARPINIIDLTAVLEVGTLIRDLNASGVRVVFAGANASFRSSVIEELQKHGADTDIFYPSIHSALA
jgi:MFS superfamily sulfate permease-like transporter